MFDAQLDNLDIPIRGNLVTQVEMDIKDTVPFLTFINYLLIKQYELLREW